MPVKIALLLPFVLTAAACGSARGHTVASTEASGPPMRAVATLRTADGTDVGTVMLHSAGSGMHLEVQVKGLAPGEHGIHIHTTGQCVGPKFDSAGGHWNPAGKKHGLQNPDGAHAGDIPNLIVGEDGKGIVDTILTGGTLGDLLDVDGAALVVHAKPDDGKTDPSGASGDRIACAVLAAG